MFNTSYWGDQKSVGFEQDGVRQKYMLCLDSIYFKGLIRDARSNSFIGEAILVVNRNLSTINDTIHCPI